jgi:hypothetical protein
VHMRARTTSTNRHKEAPWSLLVLFRGHNGTCSAPFPRRAAKYRFTDAAARQGPSTSLTTIGPSLQGPAYIYKHGARILQALCIWLHTDGNWLASSSAGTGRETGLWALNSTSGPTIAVSHISIVTPRKAPRSPHWPAGSAGSQSVLACWAPALKSLQRCLVVCK